MTAALLLPVLKSQPKSVNLSHKGLKKIPKAIGQLTNVLRLELQGNKIKSLPVEFGNLVQVSVQVATASTDHSSPGRGRGRAGESCLVICTGQHSNGVKRSGMGRMV